MTVEEGTDEIALMKEGAILVGHLATLSNPDASSSYNARNLTTFAMDLMPRISRAQSMDVLSSQSNLAGYKAVVDAATEHVSAFPMMMTAAGTVAPARVFVMGVGVAGLQPSPPPSVLVRWSPPTMCAPPPASRSRAWAASS